MALPIKKSAEKYTYRDYRQWPDYERWEIIYGLAFNMSPAPSPQHQKILGEIFTEINQFLRNKSCQVFIAPFDVRLPENNEADDEIDTVVQPDLSVICDPGKIDDRGCNGAPDLIVEILSPTTAGKDMREKLFLYEKHNVKEYWIVHPSENVIQVYRQGDNDKYQFPQVYTNEDIIKTELLPGLEINPETIFGIKKTEKHSPDKKN